jgi:hypothetical protein
LYSIAIYSTLHRTKCAKTTDNEEDQMKLRPRASTGDAHRRSRGATSVVSRTRQSLGDSERRLRIIDEHMWQHRQEERDLKRAENDIKRNQRELKRSLKSYELEMEKRQKEETDWLLGQQTRMMQSQQKDQHERVRGISERRTNNKIRHSSINEYSKEYIKKEGELSNKYQKLMDALEMKRSEVETMSKSFEAKIRAKEVQ